MKAIIFILRTKTNEREENKMLTEKTLTVNRGLEQKTNKKNRIFIKVL